MSPENAMQDRYDAYDDMVRHECAAARADAFRKCAIINREMAATIGALPGSSIWAALEACAERMDEIAEITRLQESAGHE